MKKIMILNCKLQKTKNMLQYHHTKKDLAIAVGRNMSKHTNEPVWIQCGAIKSVNLMKFVDTTVLQVCRHSELPLPTHTSIILKMFCKGKEKMIS